RGRRPARPRRAVPPPAEPSPRRRHAAAFADASLRRVLEVIDLRRPPTQLRPMLAAGLADSIAAYRHSSRVSQAAVLRRVRLQAAAGPGAAETAFEVAAVYSRGPRMHAIACRIEQRPTVHGRPGWQMVALHIG
ncbi:Rv3235 family protein, partial [Mycolicibacterium palauense]|uniref:Rv3235 family protein n=1 Tax=Mycolicibacterium palauense TaxID=2034511 RepID=UPI000BFEEE3A